MELIINNASGVKVNRAMIRKLAKKVSLPAGRQAKRDWIVSISFVKRGAMKKLNSAYRKKDMPTDVLSFNMNEGKLLGDVVVCPSVAKMNARKYNVSFNAEIARLVAHGILHLLGYDHGRKMFEMQDKIMEVMNHA
jgi:probable rRNA maturation factor